MFSNKNFLLKNIKNETHQLMFSKKYCKVQIKEYEYLNLAVVT